MSATASGAFCDSPPGSFERNAQFPAESVANHICAFLIMPSGRIHSRWPAFTYCRSTPKHSRYNLLLPHLARFKNRDIPRFEGSKSPVQVILQRVILMRFSVRMSSSREVSGCRNYAFILLLPILSRTVKPVHQPMNYVV